MIGIIVAMQEELEAIKEKMEKVEIKRIYEMEFYQGSICQKSCIIVKSGIGKVNAARTTQAMTDHFNLEYIINIGSAGALQEDLKIGDIIIANDLIQHDFDITAFGHERGYITGIGKEIFCSSELLDKVRQKASLLAEENFSKIGRIVSGDSFCTNIQEKEKIKNTFCADAIEMEGAAIAQVCYLNKIPFIVIRAISDTPNGNNQIDFDQFLKFASQKVACFITECFLKL